MKNPLSKYFDIAVYSLLVLILLGLFVPYLHAGFKVPSNAMQVYWKENGQEYSETRSTRLCTKMDVVSKLRFDGFNQVNSLRLDPITNTDLSDRIDIKQIRALENNSGSLVWSNINLEMISYCHNCTTKKTPNDTSVSTTDSDSWFELPLLDNKNYSGIEIEFLTHSKFVSPINWLKYFFMSNHITKSRIICNDSN